VSLAARPRRLILAGRRPGLVIARAAGLALAGWRQKRRPALYLECSAGFEPATYGLGNRIGVLSLRARTWCASLDSNQHWTGSQPVASAVGLGAQSGGKGWIRTSTALLFRQPLYRWSYLANMVEPGGFEPP
jgi:hypothetical protein